MSLESDELKFIAQVWGEEFADALIADPGWPGCNQNGAIAAAEAIVTTAITGIAAILDGGADFRPHVRMISATTWRAFQESMPDKKKKVRAWQGARRISNAKENENG